MRYVKISNKGTFDIGAAVNMLGASVKTTSDPIGMFGSGTKFALAQIVREGIKAKIWDGSNLWNVTSDKKTFRDREFQMVQLRVTNGRKIDTPITTEFGAHDWTDDWFIFREFVSNARDEGATIVTLTDGCDCIPNETAIYLPYERFKKYYDDVNELFTDKKDGELWIGSGKMYRQSVYIGTLKGTTINFNSRHIRINECRVMDSHDARYTLSCKLSNCDSVDIWEAFFKSDNEFADSLFISINLENTGKAIHEALTKVYGAKYTICPNVNELLRDAVSLGYVPVVLPKQLNLCANVKGLVNSYLAHQDNKVTRDMSEVETEAYNAIRYKCRAFIPMDMEINVKVFSEGMKDIAGLAQIGTNTILIRDTEFADPLELANTIIHEIGHIITGAGDYDRKFTDWFITALVTMANYANDLEAYADTLEASANGNVCHYCRASL